MTARRCVLVRHAEAAPDLPDHDRPLTPAGREQARRVGMRVRAAGIVPEFILCSTAVRARQTLGHACGAESAASTAPAAEFTPELYAAALDDAFDLINRVDPGVGTLMLVGHNPTMAQLAAAFAGPDGVGPLPGFPPGCVAMVDLAVDWLYAAPGTGRVTLL